MALPTGNREDVDAHKDTIISRIIGPAMRWPSAAPSAALWPEICCAASVETVDIHERSLRALASRGGGIVPQPDVVRVFRRIGVEPGALYSAALAATASIRRTASRTTASSCSYSRTLSAQVSCTR